MLKPRWYLAEGRTWPVLKYFSVPLINLGFDFPLFARIIISFNDLLAFLLKSAAKTEKFFILSDLRRTHLRAKSPERPENLFFPFEFRLLLALCYNIKTRLIHHGERQNIECEPERRAKLKTRVQRNSKSVFDAFQWYEKFLLIFHFSRCSAVISMPHNLLDARASLHFIVIITFLNLLTRHCLITTSLTLKIFNTKLKYWREFINGELSSSCVTEHVKKLLEHFIRDLLQVLNDCASKSLRDVTYAPASISHLNTSPINISFHCDHR